MKKQPLSLLPVLTLVFAAFTLGFFLGKNQNHETIQLSAVSRTPRHDAVPATAAPGETISLQLIYPININTASVYELAELPGIGESIARRIVEYRMRNGDFSVCEDLMKVDGIGTGKLEAILDLITTGG